MEQAEEKEPNPGLWIIAAGGLSFVIGVIFFLTIAQTKSGDPIPPDASLFDYRHDAG